MNGLKSSMHMVITTCYQILVLEAVCYAPQVIMHSIYFPVMHCICHLVMHCMLTAPPLSDHCLIRDVRSQLLPHTINAILPPLRILPALVVTTVPTVEDCNFNGTLQRTTCARI